MVFYLTTSWDDGHILDLRVADLLDQHGLTGTFYIARQFLEQRMSDEQLRQLAQRHELGAHTLTHPTLTDIPLDSAREEISGSKKWLEDVIGQPIETFCYPRGHHNADLQQIVRESGFRMARSVEAYKLSAGSNPYAVPTTLQIYPYPLRPLDQMAWWRGWRSRIQPILSAFAGVRLLHLSPWTLRQGGTFADALLAQAKQQGGIWHLWGHSWEIEQYQLWDQLADWLKRAQQSGGEAIPNSRLVR